MTALRALTRGWRLTLVSASVLFAAGAFGSPAGATPTYQGGASAGWAYQEGDVLTANPGTWTSTTNITYSYAWFDEYSVALGTGPTYTVAGKDVGHQIYAAITATDAISPSLTVNTPTVGPMRYRPPVNVKKPSVSGPLLQGSTLVADAGKWVAGGASTAPIQIDYAWYRGCSTSPKPDCSNTGIIGGTSSLVLSTADVGRVISLSVTASYPDGAGGDASSPVWLTLGQVVSSSVEAGDTLSGTVQWTVSAPGSQAIAILVNGTQTAVQVPDTAGAVTFALDTTKLAYGSNSLAVTVTWNDGIPARTVPIGSVTVSNTPLASPPALVVKPVIAEPTAVPRRPVAGKRFVVVFTVARSDNHQPLTRGRMICDPSLSGRVIAHAASFANGKARLVFTVPKTAKHKVLTVRLTIKLGHESTTRVATFVVS
jgi:hypothetical protein